MWMHLEVIMLSEKQPDMEGYILYDFAYVRFLEWSAM